MPVDVLVIDNDAILRRVVGTMLAGRGITTVSVANGRSALTLLAAFSPHIVLLDPASPAADESSSTHELRRYAGDVPIVLMTPASTSRQVAAEIRAAGCLLKPFRVDDLLRAVLPYVSHSAGPACTHAEGEQPPLTGTRRVRPTLTGSSPAAYDTPSPSGGGEL